MITGIQKESADISYSMSLLRKLKKDLEQNDVPSLETQASKLENNFT